MNLKQNSQNLGSLQKISKQINSLLNSRKKIVQNSLNTVLSARPQVTQTYNRQITAHCNQYTQIKTLVQDFSKNPNYFRSITDQNNQFWEINQKTQRDLQKRLKNLKEIDTHIDHLIQQEIGTAKQIEQIEEIIRTILNKKEHDHINKAQPLYMKKQAIIRILQQIKAQKESVKQQKLAELHKILQILYQMKNLRQKRLENCQKSSIGTQSISLLQCLSKDIEQLISNKKTQINYENNQKKMFMLINQANQKVQKLSKQPFEMFDTQMKAFEQINQMFKVKSELGYFQQRILSFFQTNEQQLFKVNQKFQNFIQTENQKSTQLGQVAQGINTTEDTIDIFENLQHNLQTQTLRRKQLLDKITRLNKSHAIERERRQTISQRQARIQSIKINLSKLQTMLQQAAQEADVKGYKVVHSQIDDLLKHIKLQSNQLQKMKNAKRQAAKRIYHETTSIQEQYRDLISEMFPQIWFRDNDFSKEQTIADFDVYLGKLFSRLKILA